jgi:hypothetical protein
MAPMRSVLPFLTMTGAAAILIAGYAAHQAAEDRRRAEQGCTLVATQAGTLTVMPVREVWRCPGEGSAP